MTAKATKRWKATIGADQYQGETSSIEYTPNYSGTVWKGGDDNTIADVTPGDPQVTIVMQQDTENPDSLWRLFHDAPAGTSMDLTWAPHYDGTFAVKVTLSTIKPPLKTDRAGGIPEVTLQLPCSEAVTATNVP